MEQLRSSEDVLVAPGVFNPLTARVVESLGFEAVYLGGGYTAGASLATPEPMLTRSEMSSMSRKIAEAVDIPLIVDANAGFGNPAHTYWSVDELINSGVDAIHLEDQVHPKRVHYHSGISHVVSEDEMLQKITAAIRAKEDNDSDLSIIARTDAGSGDKAEDFESAIARINTYIDAGADMGMLFPTSADELRTAAENVDGKLMFVMAEDREPRPTVSELNEIGYEAAIYPLTPTIVTVEAIESVYQRLLQDGFTGLEKAKSKELVMKIEEYQGLPDLYSIEEESGLK